ncbi:MAG TPA: hypothetical protein VG457_09245 [Planctomycetota bacterium]|jgi:hypothetical protein|nr:hypothetical protein [Planctomycetota bacterium]
MWGPLLLVLVTGLLPQARKPDPKKIDEAINRGVSFLRGAERPRYPDRQIASCDELVLWTLVHAGVPESDALFQELLKSTLEGPLERTYKVVLQAMILEELDRVRYQGRIAQCAQFLADNQCGNGQWSYGAASEFTKDVPTGTPLKSGVATDGARPRSVGAPADGRFWQKPKVLATIAIKKMKEGPGEGDNSNSQYAALGLRACFDAGVQLPKETVELARKWWRESQNDGGKGKKGRPNVATSASDAGAPAEPAGWCYGGKTHGHSAYGSMSAGAVGALVIYDHLLGEKAKADPWTLAGLAWMGQNFLVTDNPGPPEWGEGKPGYMTYYYLYAMERAGILFGTEVLGGHRWYSEGAEHILRTQKPDGSWSAGGPEANSTWETCFAILFLKRATRPLEDVASEDRFHKRP